MLRKLTVGTYIGNRYIKTTYLSTLKTLHKPKMTEVLNDRL